MFQDRLQQFTDTLRTHPDTEAANMLTVSLHAWARYFSFLQIIRRRYMTATVPYVQAFQTQMEGIGARGVTQPTAIAMTAEDVAEMQRLANVGLELHLDIESFFVFADIFLDRIASTFSYCFWRHAKWNHRQLMTRFQSVCAEKQLCDPHPELLQMPAELHAKIVPYRNARITHAETPRHLFGSVWGEDKKVRISPSLIYPTAEEAESAQEPTGDIEEILALLDSYMSGMLDFFEANEDKSILGLQNSKRPTGTTP